MKRIEMYLSYLRHTSVKDWTAYDFTIVGLIVGSILMATSVIILSVLSF